MKHIRVLTVVMLFAAAFVAGVGSAAPAGADHSTSSYPNNMQWNICGKKCLGGATAVSDAIAGSVLSSGRQKPLVITIQEMCSAQYNRLFDLLVYDHGYDPWYYIAADFDDAANPSCTWFGNAVFWLGGKHADGPFRDDFNTQSATDLAKATPERRGYVCSKSTIGPRSGCSGHVTNQTDNAWDGQPVKAHQLRQFVDWVVFSDACCVATFMQGDMNLSVAALNYYDSRPYAQMQESDELGSTNDRSTMVSGGEHWELTGANVYAEKNWGAGFPARWWWGQAQGFDRPDVCVAFSGGVLTAGPVAMTVGGAIVRVGSDVIRMTPPTTLVRSSVSDGSWKVDARGARTRVRMSGDGTHREPHVLPVPLPAERRNVDTDFEHLAASIELNVVRGGRTLFEGRSELAALEVGYRPGEEKSKQWVEDALGTVPVYR